MSKGHPLLPSGQLWSAVAQHRREEEEGGMFGSEQYDLGSETDIHTGAYRRPVFQGLPYGQHGLRACS